MAGPVDIFADVPDVFADVPVRTGPRAGWLERSQARQNAARAQSDIDEAKNQPMKDTIAHGALAAADTMALGMADEVRGLWAGTGALVPGGESPTEAYARARDDQREASSMAAEQSPAAAYVGEQVGTYGPALLGGAASMARTVPQLIKEGARAGAVGGATSGFGHGEGWDDSISRAEDGAVVGALLGGAGAGAGRLAAPVLQKLAGSARNGLDATGRAAGAVVDLADRNPMARDGAAFVSGGSSAAGLGGLRLVSKMLQRKPAPATPPTAAPAPPVLGEGGHWPAPGGGLAPRPSSSPVPVLERAAAPTPVTPSVPVAGPAGAVPPTAPRLRPRPDLPPDVMAGMPPRAAAPAASPKPPKLTRKPRAQAPRADAPQWVKDAPIVGTVEGAPPAGGLNTYEGAVAALRATKDAGDRLVLSSRLDDMGWSSAQRDQLFKAAGLQTQAEQLASAAPSAPAPKPSAPLPEPVPDSGPPLSGAQEARRASGAQIGPRAPLSADELKAAAVDAVAKGEPLKALAKRLGVRQSDVSTFYKAAQIGN